MSDTPIVKEFFTREQFPEVTFCLMRFSDTFIASGMAVCPQTEFFDSQKGRKLAEARAWAHRKSHLQHFESVNRKKEKLLS